MGKKSMAILLLSMALVPLTAVPEPECACNSQQCRNSKALADIAKRVQQQYDKLPKPRKRQQRIAPEALAPVLLEGWQKHRISPQTAIRIMHVESKFDALAVNRRTHDYGLMQINTRTAKAMGLSRNCLMDWRCNLRAGLAIAAYAQKRGNLCRYNVGTGKLQGRRLANCNIYSRKLASVSF